VALKEVLPLFSSILSLDLIEQTCGDTHPAFLSALALKAQEHSFAIHFEICEPHLQDLGNTGGGGIEMIDRYSLSFFLKRKTTEEVWGFAKRHKALYGVVIGSTVINFLAAISRAAWSFNSRENILTLRTTTG
jgi:hypothetical protein